MTRFVLLRAALIASALTPLSAAAQRATTATPAAAAPVTGWQAAGSDIPTDAAWRQGVLPNGVRYAVRRSTQPAGAVSIRVRIGAGGLYESDREQGWSHLLEHMVFRGTEHFADGEGIKLWQRLGASFGSDTNAQTQLTQTTYQLDLPHPDAAGLRQAMQVVAEMMDSARIDPALLATERKVVEAELALRLTPLVKKIKDAQQPLFFAGTKAAVRDVIGTRETLANADAASLKAYYEAWYRPDNAVVAVTGDMDPALLEAELKRAFGPWKASGAKRPLPDWGSPTAPAVAAATVSDPQAPESLAIAYVAPHPEGPFTAARQQRQYTEGVAIGIINQRFAAAARRGEAIVNAGIQRSEQLHVADQFTVYVQPKPGQWKAALDQAYGIINGALARPPAQAEIDQATAAMTNALQQRVASAATQTAPALADGFIGDVNNGDITAAPDYYLTLFETLKKGMTPALVGETMKRLLAPAPRLLVFGPQPVPGGATEALAALASAEKVAGGAAAELRAVSLDQLTLPGKPATASAPATIAGLDAQRYLLSNGVELIVKKTAFEKDRVYVSVRVGPGLLGEPRDGQSLLWSAGALGAAGVGPFTADELGRVLAGHQYGYGVNAALDSLQLNGVTNAADLPGMLKLVTGQIVSPRFDQATVDRLRTGTLANYEATYSQPGSVLSAFGGAALHGGDARFTALPPRSAIEALTLPRFRDFWTAKLAQGPVRVTIVGDVDPAAAVTAVSGTVGRLAPRMGTVPSGTEVHATATAPVVELTHRGDPDQMLLLRAWSVPSDVDDHATATALDLAATIVQTGLTEGFRETQGGTYSPFAADQDSPVLPHYGIFLAGAQVAAAQRPVFAAALDKVVADLAAHGPSADAFSRAQTTAISAVDRSRQNNGWWLGVLSGPLTPAFVTSTVQRKADLQALTPAKVQAAVAGALTKQAGFELAVVPEKK